MKAYTCTVYLFCIVYFCVVIFKCFIAHLNIGIEKYEQAVC